MFNRDDLDKPFKFWAGRSWRMLAEIARTRLWHGVSHRITDKITVPEDFIGINVAAAQDAAADDYILERLKDCCIRHVRLYMTPETRNGAQERLLKRLLDEGIGVLLVLRPTREQSELFTADLDALKSWGAFVDQILEVYGSQLEYAEIGVTPNRARWSGHSHRGYLKTWEMALHSARKHGVKLAGPNVSDFEPLYNLLFLQGMRDMDALPSVHTDNLFVERTREPEQFDRRVAGSFLGRYLKLDLVRKARILAAMSKKYGVNKTYCTYTCWNTLRLARWSQDVAQKNGDYLFRYLVLAAASGALDRIYWGPLIGIPDGLIADGSEKATEVERVSDYLNVPGGPEQYEPLPVYSVFRHICRWLPGSTLEPVDSADAGAFAFALKTRDERRGFTAWTRDRGNLPADAVGDKSWLTDTKCLDASGRILSYAPGICERPRLWFHRDAIPLRTAPSEVNFKHAKDLQYFPDGLNEGFLWEDKHWFGMTCLETEDEHRESLKAFHPARGYASGIGRTLRDKRNLVLRVSAPTVKPREWVLKTIRVRGLKRISYLFMPGKARRHWNNAHEMRRQGISTPRPVAFFEQRVRGSVRDSIYLAEAIDCAGSVRDAVYAFNAGKEEFAGWSRMQVLESVAGFIAHMHRRKIVHRDLSAGNLLLVRGNDGTVQPQVIDIGRARRYENQLTNRQRCLDLVRIAHPMNWGDRKILLRLYSEKAGNSFKSIDHMRFHRYDTKHWLKKYLRSKRR